MDDRELDSRLRMIEQALSDMLVMIQAIQEKVGISNESEQGDRQDGALALTKREES